RTSAGIARNHDHHGRRRAFRRPGEPGRADRPDHRVPGTGPARRPADVLLDAGRGALMDIALILGLVLAFGALLAMISMEGASITALLLPAPMVLVLGATIAVGIASGTLRDFLNAAAALPRAFRGQGGTTRSVIDTVVGYADRARTQGLLSLEQGVADEKDPVLRQALQSIADGVDAEDLRILLEDA